METNKILFNQTAIPHWSRWEEFPSFALEEVLKENTPITPEELQQLIECCPQHEKVLLCTAISKEKVEAIITIIQSRYQGVVPSLKFAHHFIYKKCGRLYAQLGAKILEAYTKNTDACSLYEAISCALREEGAITTHGIYLGRKPPPVPHEQK